VLDLSDYVVGSGKHGPEIGGHPSDNIPVALAAGEARRRSGLDVLAAIAVGYELYGRFKGLMDRSGPWDGVSLSGFVAPAIAGRLMGLDAGRLAHALALGGARCATPAIVRRGGISAAKSISNALVAQSAVEATLLAERGVTGPLAILEHPRGLRSVFPNGDIEATMTAAFPSHSYIMRSNVKAYPCLATGQAAVAAALELHGAVAAKLDGLRRIDVVMADYPFVRDQQADPGRVHPQSREAADHSFQFLVAVALADGTFGPAQFENERWLDPRLVALMGKIVTSTDAALNRRAPGTYPCAVRVVDGDGREHAAEVLFPPGYSHGGIAESDVVAKFDAIAATLDRARRERIVSAVLEFDRAPDTDALTAALRAP
jgi:2-methylcitrate dehydratase